MGRSYEKKWIILAVTSVSTFMATLDGSIVNIALPQMAGNLNQTISTIQWVVTSYLLTISLTLLIFGKLSDIYGRKKIFSSGFLVFAAGSLLCGLSGSLRFLVVSRIIQAFGASAMMSLSQGIVTTSFPPNERGKALGTVGTMVALGNLVGPSLGGILVHAFGWQSVFYINIPIGIIGFILSTAVIPKTEELQENKYFDYKGSVSFSLFLLFMFLGLLFAQEGVLPLRYLAPLLAFSAIALFIFIRFEKKSVNPLLDLNMMKIHEFSFGLTAAYFAFIAINSTLLFMPFYLQDLMKYSALKAGLIISIYPITMAFVAPISGWLSDKFSYRPLTVGGMLVSTVALLLLSRINPSTPIYTVMLYMALFGIGMAAFQSPNTSSIMGSVAKDRLGIAGGMNALFRNLGLVSGTTFSVMIFSFSTKMNINAISSGSFNPNSFLKGFSLVLIFDAVCTVAALIISLGKAVNSKIRISENAETE